MFDSREITIVLSEYRQLVAESDRYKCLVRSIQAGDMIYENRLLAMWDEAPKAKEEAKK